jgi:hypothetical protein
MEDRERNGRLSPEIYVYATNKNFLNLYDALRIDKVKLEIAGYDPTTKRQTGQANAWLDVDDARLLCHLATHRLFKPVTGGKWEKFGGSQKEDGSIESRTISIEWDEGDNGRFARFPYRVTIANGPGRKTQTGGVSPDGPAKSLLSMRLPESDMIKVMLALRDYVQAYEAAHHHRIVADRIRELRDKLAVRSERFETHERDAITARAERPSPQQQPQPAAQTPPPLQAIPGGAQRPLRSTTTRNPNSDRSHLTPLRAEG